MTHSEDRAPLRDSDQRKAPIAPRKSPCCWTQSFRSGTIAAARQRFDRESEKKGGVMKPINLRWSVRDLFMVTGATASGICVAKLNSDAAVGFCLGVLTAFVATGLIQQILFPPEPVAAGRIPIQGRRLCLGLILRIVVQHSRPLHPLRDRSIVFRNLMADAAFKRIHGYDGSCVFWLQPPLYLPAPGRFAAMLGCRPERR